MFKAFKSIRREKQRQKKLKTQIRERQAYNKMQRGGTLKPSERRAARKFVSEGKPSPKWR